MLSSTERIVVSAVGLATCACVVAAAPTPQPSAQSEPEAPAQKATLDLPELVASVKPSVVTILTYDADGKFSGQGSGFFIAKNRIVTNHHVIEGAHRAEIKLASGQTIEIAGLLAEDVNHDLALLQVDPAGGGLATVTIKPLPLAQGKPREGERIAVIGSPFGLEQTVSEGIVSAVRELPGLGTVIQITAAISPGSSGSPVLNMHGEVIAVANSHVVKCQSINFAIPVEHFRAMRVGQPRVLAEIGKKERPATKEAKDEFRLGGAALLKGDIGTAIAHFRRVVTRSPSHAAAWLAIGYCESRLDHHQEAIDAYKKTIQIRPDYSEAYANMGITYLLFADYSKAIEAFKEAIRIKPDLVGAHFGLGSVYVALGDKGAALDEYKVLRELDTDAANKLFNFIYE